MLKYTHCYVNEHSDGYIWEEFLVFLTRIVVFG